jgi:predicted DNA-binding WGR domain protein
MTGAAERYFEFVGGASKKFWAVRVQGSSLTVRFGRIGTGGQTKTKALSSADEASRAADRLVREKTNEGYRPGKARQPRAAKVAPGTKHRKVGKVRSWDDLEAALREEGHKHLGSSKAQMPDARWRAQMKEVCGFSLPPSYFEYRKRLRGAGKWKLVDGPKGWPATLTLMKIDVPRSIRRARELLRATYEAKTPRLAARSATTLVPFATAEGADICWDSAKRDERGEPAICCAARDPARAGDRAIVRLGGDLLEVLRHYRQSSNPGKLVVPKVAPVDDDDDESDDDADEAPAKGATPKGSPAWRRQLKHAADPYAAAGTTAVFHRIKLGGTKGAQTKGRASSGGSPILAKGQSWPMCGTCKKQLSLYLQFDVEKRFGLAFKPGSHFLFFNCTTCDGLPPVARSNKLPDSFLNANGAQSCRVILNPPGVSEVVHPADPTMRAQSPIGFESHPETLTDSLDCPVGEEGVKIGGAPSWTQPPRYKQCACGAPLGLVLQIPEGGGAGWKRKNGESLAPFYGNGYFIFACSAQCSPFAALIVVE